MDKIIIYGAGNMGRAVFDLLEGRCEIAGFMDANPDLRGTFIEGTPVYHPSDVGQGQELFKAIILIAMTACPFSIMRRRLTDLGFTQVIPAGDYVSKLYEGQFILNTWSGGPFDRTLDFADPKSYADYEAACKWFESRHDEELDLTLKKYFPDFLSATLSNCKTMLDTAALDGGYIESFLSQAPDKNVYSYTLIPNSVPFEELAARYRDRSVRLLPCEASDVDGVAEYQRLGMMRPFTRRKTYKTEVKKIDTVMEEHHFDYLRCYSMSPALPILKGGTSSIQSYRPVMAVNIGHYQTDFEETPQYLKSICPNYRFYFRMHSYQGNDCILYAIPKEMEGNV